MATNIDKKLIKKRALVKSRPTRLINNVSRNEDNVNYLQTIMPELQMCRKEFDDVQSDIEDCSDNIDENEYESFENNYLDIMAKINQFSRKQFN